MRKTAIDIKVGDTINLVFLDGSYSPRIVRNVIITHPQESEDLYSFQISTPYSANGMFIHAHKDDMCIANIEKVHPCVVTFNEQMFELIKFIIHPNVKKDIGKIKELSQVEICSGLVELEKARQTEYDWDGNLL